MVSTWWKINYSGVRNKIQRLWIDILHHDHWLRCESDKPPFDTCRNGNITPMQDNSYRQINLTLNNQQIAFIEAKWMH